MGKKKRQKQWLCVLLTAAMLITAVPVNGKDAVPKAAAAAETAAEETGQEAAAPSGSDGSTKEPGPEAGTEITGNVETDGSETGTPEGTGNTDSTGQDSAGNTDSTGSTEETGGAVQDGTEQPDSTTERGQEPEETGTEATEEGTETVQEPQAEDSTQAAGETETVIVEQETETEPETETDKKKEDRKKKEEDKKAQEKAEKKGKKKKKKKTQVTEVHDLASFIQAVQAVTAEDDLSPAYLFYNGSAVAQSQGEDITLADAAGTQNGSSCSVPEDTFAEDDLVDQARITDGDGVVAVDTVASVSDYEVAKKESSTELYDPYHNRHLIVHSGSGFDPKGAESIIQGYADLFVLTYATREETKEACAYLQTVPGLTVLPDVAFSQDSVQKTDGTDSKGQTDILQSVKGAADVTVAVLDSGFDYAGSADVRVLNGVDVSGTGTMQDENGHGTIMADIILKHTAEEVKILPVKVSDAEGRTTALRLYMGICQAVEMGADVINISLSSYRAAGAEFVQDAIRAATGQGIIVTAAAGNAGEDTADYCPANISEALTVSAVNANKVIDTYSNRGAAVDYSAYGSVEACGISGAQVTASGTSVSAAVVAAVYASALSSHPEMEAGQVTELVDEQAEDLGTPGRDDSYGKGLLTLDSITAVMESRESGNSEILTCDWKNLGDEQLNALIDASDELVLYRFLAGLSETDRMQLFARDTFFNREVANFETTEDGTVTSEYHGTLGQYLLSENFRSFYPSLTVRPSGNYWMYYHDSPVHIFLNTNKNSKKAKIIVKATQPAQNGTLTLGITMQANDSAYDFSNVKASDVSVTTTEDNNHTNVLNNIIIKGIKVDKPAHSKATGQKRAPTDDKEGNASFYPSSFTSFGSNECAKTTTGVTVKLGTTDLHDTYEINGQPADHPHTLTVDFTSYGTNTGMYGADVVTQYAACSHAGSVSRSRNITCKECGAVVKTETQTDTIPQLAHAYSGYLYASNNNIENGMRYRQCTRSEAECGRGTDVYGQPWQTEITYLQQVFYRYQDEDGNWPGYTPAVNDYLAPGAYYVWNLGHTDADHATEFIDTGASGTNNGIRDYTVPGYASQHYIDIHRKKYTVKYNSNGGTGSMDGRTVYAARCSSWQRTHLREPAMNLLDGAHQKTGKRHMGTRRK